MTGEVQKVDPWVIPHLDLMTARTSQINQSHAFPWPLYGFLSPAYYLVQHVARNRHKYCWPPLRRYHYPIWARPFTQNTSWTLMSKYIKSWTHLFWSLPLTGFSESNICPRSEDDSGGFDPPCGGFDPPCDGPGVQSGSVRNGISPKT